MAPELDTEDRAAIAGIAAGLESAWNAADGDAYASYFREDADFVNIYGLHAKGRAAIAAGHNMIFRTIYRGSTLGCYVKQTRMIGDGVALAHMNSLLHYAEGVKESMPSLVLTREDGVWKIASFHNTLITALPPMIAPAA